MAEIQKTTLVAYVPAVTRGYVDFYRSNADVDTLAVADSTLLQGNRAIEKDLRALPPGVSAKALGSIVNRKVITIGADELAEHLAADRLLILPDDEISEAIIKRFNIGSNQSKLLPIFLRWNRRNVATQIEVQQDRTIDISEVDPVALQLLQGEVIRSNDWWRQVAAVVTDGCGYLSSHNRYVPTNFDAEIVGDVRSHSSKGKDLEYYNTIHAEQALVARSARQGFQLEGAKLYTSTFPCPTCAKLCAEAGISQVFFFDGYAVADGYDVLKAADVEIVRVTGNSLPEHSRVIPVKYPE